MDLTAQEEIDSWRDVLMNMTATLTVRHLYQVTNIHHGLTPPTCLNPCLLKPTQFCNRVQQLGIRIEKENF